MTFVGFHEALKKQCKEEKIDIKSVDVEMLYCEFENQGTWDAVNNKLRNNVFHINEYKEKTA